MRGDRPADSRRVFTPYVFTPHARGSTPPTSLAVEYRGVYPACAGIDHVFGIQRMGELGLPRMRGDRPRLGIGLTMKHQFTPHARGSTCRLQESIHPIRVYPACAGIDPKFNTEGGASNGLPRMRGDRPPANPQPSAPQQFTPHARGSTLCTNPTSRNAQVYPACAGIDLDR